MSGIAGDQPLKIYPAFSGASAGAVKGDCSVISCSVTTPSTTHLTVNVLNGTFTVHFALTPVPSTVAVIVAVPGPTAVTTPFESTFATFSSDEV